MKKLLLALAAGTVIAAPAAYSQDTARSPFKKGTISIGTRLGIGELAGGSDFDGKSGIMYALSLSPSAGYFLTDNLMAYATLAGGVHGRTFGPRYASNYAGIGLGARYYFGRAENAKGEVKRFRVFADAGAMYQHQWSKVELSDSVTLRGSGNGIDIHGGLGLNYLITRNVAFEAGMSYNRNLYNANSFRELPYVQLELGLRVFLNGSSRK